MLKEKKDKKKKHSKKLKTLSSPRILPFSDFLFIFFNLEFREHLNFLASVHQLSNIHILSVSLQLILECNMISGQHP